MSWLQKFAYPTLHFADEATIPSHRSPSRTRVSLVLAKPVSPSPKIVPFAGFPSHLLPAESPQGSIGPAFPVDLQLLGSMIHGSFGVPHVTSGWGGKSHSFQQVLQFWGHEFEILRASRVCLVLNIILTPYAICIHRSAKAVSYNPYFKRGWPQPATCKAWCTPMV